MTSQVQQFLELMHRLPDDIPTAYVYLWQKGTKLGSNHRTYWYEIGEELPPYQEHVHTYYSVHPCKTIPTTNAKGQPAPAYKVRGKVEDIASVAVIFAEFDLHEAPAPPEPPPGLPGPGQAQPEPALGGKAKKQLLAAIDLIDPKPSVVVDSGGGFHCYWPLVKPVKASPSIRRLQEAWVNWLADSDLSPTAPAGFTADPASKDLARVLRLPGTTNWKYDAPHGRPVHVVRFNPESTFAPSELRAVVPAEVNKATGSGQFTVDFSLPSSATQVVTADAETGEQITLVTVADVESYLKRVVGRELTRVRTATEGGRNTALNQSSFAIGRYLIPGDMDADAVAHHLLQAALASGLSRREAATTIAHGLAAGQEDLPQVVFRTPADIVDDAASTPSSDTVGLIKLRKELARVLSSADTATRDAWGEVAKEAGLGGKTALSQAMKEARPTDADLRDAFCRQHPQIVYHPALEWMQYQEGAYAPVPDHLVRKWISETIDEVDRSTLTAGRVESVAKLLYYQLCRQVEDWDSKDLIVCQNGTIELLPGKPLKLRKHRRDDFSTHSVPYALPTEGHFAQYCPNFLQAVGRLPPDVGSFLQEFVGYCLTRDTRHDIMVWIVGRPGSGKSTLIRGILTALGNHAAMLSLREFNRSRFALNAVVGKTLLYGADVGTDFIDNTDALNTLVSGDPIRVEAKYANAFEIRPTAKILWAMTKMPSLRDPDDGLFRRVQVVQVPPLPPDQADPNIRIAVEQEGPGILLWAIRGLARLRTRGYFEVPPAVRQHTIRYRDDQDKTQHFVRDVMVAYAPSTDALASSPPGELAGEPTESIDQVAEAIAPKPPTAASIYAAYKSWCRISGYNPLGKYKLYEELRRLDLVLDKSSGSNVLVCSSHYLRSKSDWDTESFRVEITDKSKGIKVSN